MNFKFTSGEQPQVPAKVVEVTLAQKGADPKPMVVHQETTGPAQPDRLPLTLRLSTGVKSYGNGVEVAVTQTELYDPAVPGDKERAANAAFDWFDTLMKNRGGQLSKMLSEVQRVNPSCQFYQPQTWAPDGAPPTLQTFGAGPNPMVGKTYP